MNAQVMAFKKNVYAHLTLVEKVETIINSEGLNSVGVINLKVLNGNIDDLSSQRKNEILDALLQYNKCTNRFIQN